MDVIPEHQLSAFVTACHRVAAYGLLKCSSGNLSCRLDDDRVMITATRSWLADLTPEQVSLLRFSDGQLVNDAKPSVETRFQLGILRQRADLNFVPQFPSPPATTPTCAD